MKFRKGFISNSSSSSFICDVCKDVQSGWDLPIEDAEMYSCTKGHTFCMSHAIKLDEEKVKKWIEKNIIDDIADYDDLSPIEIIYEIVHDDPYSVPSIICPICNLEALKDEDVIAYVFKELNTNKEKLLQEIKSKFKNQSELESYILTKPTDIDSSSTDNFLLFLLFLLN